MFRFVTILLIFKLSTSFSQERFEISGVVTATSGEPLAGINVMIQNTNKGTSTDSNGVFSIQNIQKKRIKLSFTGIGYKDRIILVDFSKEDAPFLQVSIEESSIELEEVSVQTDAAKSAAQAQAVEVLDLSSAKIKSISVPQLINQTSGLKVRQNAGVGSNTEININGLQGKAIRFFKDGVPLDYLGRAFNFSLLPVDALERIDVYKGVLPASLGSDALGGGVNFVTKQRLSNYLDASYQYGSFNSQQFNLNGYYAIPNSKFGVSLSSYYISSDNDYKIDVLVPDPETAREEEANVRRFHDGVAPFYSEVKVDLHETSFADRWEIGFNYFDYDKELQNDIYQTEPYGEANFEESNFGLTMRYQKQFDRFSADVFAVYGELKTKTIDTTANRYNWYGEVERREENGGELSATKSLQNITFTNNLVRAYFGYKLNDEHELLLNHVYSRQTRLGSDPFAIKIANTDIDPLTIEAKYVKNVTGLGIRSSLWNNKIINEFTVKRFGILTQAVDLNFAYEGDVPEESQNNYGIANSVRYNLENKGFLRFTYEYATRIPDAEEYFGDGLFIVGNPNLVPERSHNVNLAANLPLDKQKSWWLDTNVFFRDQKNLVQLIPNIPYATYDNWSNVRVMGIEAGIKKTLHKNLTTNLNATFQDLRRVDVDNPQEELNEGSRVPNVPYLFANLNIDYKIFNPFATNDRFDLYTNFGYTHFYYRFSIPKDLESDNIFEKPDVDADEFLIPTQYVWDLGISYKVNNQPLWLSMAVNNILNEDQFDNFRVQKPGRNINFKIRYTIN
ncbi:TonB-dependent receptor [Galbibacter sp. BG1]|uniref:TonB-dependent receptor n=1 Tax=Galbibacter sp. BG1 TaxID=1170699 RepID=UPI0015B8ECA6|nr:TonB-dependent receptor [Galbibacter sp. BG1]QLE01152.1 TonB-dependent receptor [Galbibacter sp. BG1]